VLPPEGELAVLATRQHGVVSHTQLRELGFGTRAIERRLEAGRLHRLHRGVYAVGRTAVSLEGRWMAAVLACGHRALLSHRGAAALWGLRPSEAIDVTVPRGRHRRRGIVIHTARNLPADDQTIRRCIPVTTAPRTLVDLASVVTAADLERSLEEAERLRLLDLAALQRVLERCPGRRGGRLLREIIGDALPGAAATRSELERRFLALCHQAGLPPPAVNARVAGFEVDTVWLEARLIVELDSHAYHRTWAAFERDRARDTALQLAGFRVLRVTHRRLEHEPGAVLAAVRSGLDLGPALSG
jgi:hypothetical protein